MVCIGKDDGTHCTKRSHWFGSRWPYSRMVACVCLNFRLLPFLLVHFCHLKSSLNWWLEKVRGLKLFHDELCMNRIQQTSVNALYAVNTFFNVVSPQRYMKRESLRNHTWSLRPLRLWSVSVSKKKTFPLIYAGIWPHIMGTNWHGRLRISCSFKQAPHAGMLSYCLSWAHLPTMCLANWQSPTFSQTRE